MMFFHQVQIGTLNSLQNKDTNFLENDSQCLWSLTDFGNASESGFLALLPYEQLSSWSIVHNEASMPLALNIMEGVTLQLLNHHSVGNNKLYLFEAIPSKSFAHLKRLLPPSEQTWGEQIFNSRRLSQILNDFVELLHRRFNSFARAGSEDISTYNKSVPKPEPYYYLLMSGTSALYNQDIFQQIITLIRQGPKAGIVPLILYNAEEQKNIFSSDNQKKLLILLEKELRENSAGLWLIDEFASLKNHDELWKLFIRFGLKMGVDEDICKRWVDTLLIKSEQKTDNLGNQDFLTIPIGSNGVTSINFSMGEKSDVYHALIGGATRTGKTTLLNRLILTACEMLTPQQLQLTLMDFKDGVSFWQYEGLAHVATLYAPTRVDFSAALNCLETFEQQMSARYVQFREAKVLNLIDYNQVVAEPLPRCLLIADELQSLFEGQDYKQKAAVKRILSNLAKKGAAAGMHMILSTQSFQNVELESDVKDQFHLRIGLRHASTMGCRALMGRDNDAMLNLERYAAIYNSHQGEERFNRLVALAELPDFLGRLEKLKAKYPSNAQQTIQLPKVKLERVSPILKSTVTGQFVDGDVSAPW